MKKPLSSEQVGERIKKIQEAMEDESNAIKKAVGISALIELVESSILCLHLMTEALNKNRAPN